MKWLLACLRVFLCLFMTEIYCISLLYNRNNILCVCLRILSPFPIHLVCNITYIHFAQWHSYVICSGSCKGKFCWFVRKVSCSAIYLKIILYGRNLPTLRKSSVNSFAHTLVSFQRPPYSQKCFHIYPSTSYFLNWSVSESNACNILHNKNSLLSHLSCLTHVLSALWIILS